MYQSLRFYGQLKNLSKQDLKSFLDFLDDFETETRADELEFHYEGPYLDYEAYLEGIKKRLGPEVQGQIDVLDLLEWRMWRYLITGQDLQGKEIPLNNVLEKYNQE